MKKFKKLFLVMLALFFSITTITSVRADSKDFSIEAIFNDNQINRNYGYHSFDVTKDGKQEIKYRINNNSDQSMSFDVELLNAYTSPSGTIQYEESQIGQSVITDKTYELRNYLSGPEKVFVDAKSSKVITFNLDAPTDKGEMLGGIAIVSEDEDEVNNDSHLTIKDKVRYIFGVEVISDVSKHELFQFEDPYISSMPSAIYIRLPLENKNPQTISTEVNWKVSEKDGTEVFSDSRLVKFAPKTKVHFDIPFNSSEIKDLSEYIITGSIDYNLPEETSIPFEYRVKYDSNKKIEYLDEVDNELGRPAVVKSFKSYIFPIAFICLLLLLILLYVDRKRKQKREERNQ